MLKMRKLPLLVCALMLVCFSASAADFTAQPVDQGVIITSVSNAEDTLVIPALLDGKEVVGVVPGALNTAENVSAYELAEGHTRLMVQDGMLIDSQTMELLAYPPNKGPWYVTLPESIRSIGSCAFMNNQRVCNLFLPASVTKIGDYAFSDCRMLGILFVPANEVELGEDILRNTPASIGLDPSSPLVLYADRWQYPMAMIDKPSGEISPQEAARLEADCLPPEMAPQDTTSYQVLSSFGAADYYYNYLILQLVRDVGSYAPCNGLMIEPASYWSEANVGIEPEGLYGVGSVSEPSVMRAYNAAGELIGWKQVDGQFTISVAGAEKISFSGGGQIRLGLIPFEPVMMDGGSLYFANMPWKAVSNGSAVCGIVIPRSYATYSLDIPAMYINMLSSYFASPHDPSIQIKNDYVLVCMNVFDARMLEHVGYRQMFVQTQQTLSTDSLDVQYGEDMQVTQQDAENLSSLQKELQALMTPYLTPGTAYVRLLVNLEQAGYPNAVEKRLDLSPEYLNVQEDGYRSVVLHEMVHVLHSSDFVSFQFSPYAWREGYAEVLAEEAMRHHNAEFISSSATEDFSFLPASALEDFGTWFARYANQENQYEAGYEFVSFLRDTYGADMLGKISQKMAEYAQMQNIYYPGYPDGEAYGKCFKNAVIEAVGEDPFARFVEEVIK